MECSICYKSFASRYSRERHAKLTHPAASGISMKVEDRIKEEPNNVFNDSLESALSYQPYSESMDDDEEQDEATNSEDGEYEEEETQSTDLKTE